MAEPRQTVIITSVIYFSSNRLSYSETRSAFSPEERIAQTIKTVESIRQRIPGAEIILLEIGRRKDISSTLIGMVDKYIFVGNNPAVKWASSGKHKGLGEAMGLLAAAKKLKTGADFYFKVSGRYFLNENFRPDLWRGDVFLARMHNAAISTRLYGFGKKLFPDWQIALKKSLFLLYKGKSIEDIFPQKLGRELIRPVDLLGISGFIAPNAEYLAE
jgi:hypothetical protein